MKLFLASGNAHKAREFQSLASASGLPLEILSASAAGGMPPVEEDTGTFTGNARKKARALREKLDALAAGKSRIPNPESQKSPGGGGAGGADSGNAGGGAAGGGGATDAAAFANAWVMADDSGICVDALGGAPGVESAYYAGPQGDPAANLARLAAAMRGVPDGGRGAHYICVLHLIAPGGAGHVFEGRCDGRLARAPRGAGGFGYDPLFIPAGHDRTLGELGDAFKNQLSHRGRAWAAAAAFLATRCAS
ncbi:MAG: non-canonical purine NTP pyrophosphatase [Opitutaceae bacterium]|jgi:XTP/dITP diphosphohydrolase|nr:non-canonical purine NTP pyrophosphatase [Opitutaceae bacterium]